MDGLGRVVIPREYRKLHRISLGDPMEISCLDNGEIILKKMDMTLTLEELSFNAIRILSENISGSVLVSNLEKWLGGSGQAKGMFIGKEIPEIVRKHILARKDYSICDVNEADGFDVRFAEPTALLAEPVAGDGDVFGALYITGKSTISPEEIALLKTAASILGTSLQKF